MKTSYTISTFAILQIIFLTAVLTTSNILRVISFALFWISVLGMLVSIMKKKVWRGSEWIAFSAFTSSTVTGVLISAGKIIDEILLGTVLIGLLMVTAVINSIKEPKSKKASKKIEQTNPVFVVGKGKKYHKAGCQLISGRKTTPYQSEETAKMDNKSSCKICFE